MKILVTKNMNMFLIFGKNWNKNNERLSRLVFKMWCFIIADVFEKFRNNSLKNYGLCQSHYLSTPVLKITKIELELIPDSDMYICFEENTGRGIS